jgi:hypothetical protein
MTKKTDTQITDGCVTDNEALVALGYLPARCSSKKLSAKEMGVFLDLTERRINQLRSEVAGWPLEGGFGLEALSQYTYHRTGKTTTTRAALHRITNERAEVIMETIAVWTRCKLPPAEILVCVVNEIFDASLK